MFKQIICLLMLCEAAKCGAADFRNIMKKPDKNGLMVSVDVSSIVDKGRGIVDFWERESFTMPQVFELGPKSVPTRYWSALFHKRIDCLERRSVILRAVMRGKNNETLLADDVAAPAWNSVVPETKGENVMTWACARDYPISTGPNY